MNHSPTLAIIVIARNEEKTIERCIAACLEAAKRAAEVGIIGSSEVVLVDSASTDHTCEIAMRMPVRLIALPASWPLSAAAGRFVGLRSTSSDLVLFVDGDFVLDPAWLEAGLPSLFEPYVAAVSGVDREATPPTTWIARLVHEASERIVPVESIADADAVPVGLYWREWLDRAGGIQPFLKGAEDRDIAYRIRALGGRLLKTRTVMGYHHWSSGPVFTFIEYLHSVAGWSYGEGQAARYASNHPQIRRAYMRRYFHLRHLIQLEVGLLFGAWLTAVVACLLQSQLAIAGAASVLGLSVLGAFSLFRRKGLRALLSPLHEVPYVIVRLCGFFLGFLRRTPPAVDYPI